MPMRWSPGCNCCGPCGEMQVRFTPTSKFDRGGYTPWDNVHAYSEGELFSHYRNSDGRECLWRVPFDLMSGPGWLPAEEARYTFVEVLDLLDEVKEWHLYGSGWEGLTPTQKDWYLRGGRLADQMGYLSKEDVLPDLHNFTATFNFLSNAATGMKYQLFAAMTLNEQDEPLNYFACDVERVANKDEPVESGPSFSVPIKMTLSRVVDQSTAETYDIGWTNITSSPVVFCRRPEISGGQFLGDVDLGSSAIPTLRTILPRLRSPAEMAGYSFVITNGSGSINGDTGSLDVIEGDVIFLENAAEPYAATSWRIYSPGSTVSLTDVMTCGLSTETPDTENTITGMKVGVYVTSSSLPGSTYDIYSFSGVAAKLNGTITNPDCPICRMDLPCPCAMDGEYPVFARQSDSDVLLTFGEMYSDGVYNVAYGTFVPGSFVDLGYVGYAVRRYSDCRFEFLRFHLLGGRYIFPLVGGGTQRHTVDFIVWSSTWLEIIKPTFTSVRLRTYSTVRFAEINAGGISGSGTDFPPHENPGTLVANGFLESVKDPGRVRFVDDPGTYRNLATGSLDVDSIPSDLFSCNSFSVQGTYTDDVRGLAYAGPANLFLGKTWTVESA